MRRVKLFAEFAIFSVFVMLVVVSMFSGVSQLDGLGVVTGFAVLGGNGTSVGELNQSLDGVLQNGTSPFAAAVEEPERRVAAPDVDLTNRFGFLTGHESIREEGDGTYRVDMSSSPGIPGLVSVTDEPEAIIRIEGLNVSALREQSNGSKIEINARIDQIPDRYNPGDIKTTVFAFDSLPIREATIELPKTGFVEYILRCEDFDSDQFSCNGNWDKTNISFVDLGDTIRFQVDHFTAYAGGGDNPGNQANLTIWDSMDVGMPYADETIYVNESAFFFANYTNSTGDIIVGGSTQCNVSFDDYDDVMVYNATKGLYEYNRSFIIAGEWEYTILCDGSLQGYVTLNTTDSIDIQSGGGGGFGTSTVPSVGSASLINGEPENNDTLIASANATDADGDAFNLTFSWTKDSSSVTIINHPMTNSTASGDGSTVDDVSGNNYDFRIGTAAAGDSFEPNYTASCHTGGCYWFDGSDDNMTMFFDTDNLDFGTSDDFSIELWINSSGDSSATIVEKIGSGSWGLEAITGDAIRLFLSDGVGGDSTVTSTSDVMDNSWHHIVAVRYTGSNQLFMYVDGVLEAIGDADSENLGGNSGSLAVGNGFHGPFAGMIDELKIHDYALSREQVLENYNGGIGKSNTTLNLHTLIGEVWNVTVFAVDENGHLSDQSGSAVNATIQIPANTAPVVSSFSLGGEPENDDNITSSTSYTDADGDGVNLTYNWNVSGSAVTLLNLEFNDVIFTPDSETIYDYSPQANHFMLGYTAHGDLFEPNYTDSCIFGGCYRFNGETTHPNLIRTSGDVDDLDFAINDNFTIEAWVNSDSENSGTIIQKFSWIMGIANGGIAYFVISDGGGGNENLTSSTSVVDGSWHQVVAVRDRGSDSLLLYIDGQLEAVEADGENSIVNNQPVQVGDGFSGGFTGLIDGVRVYDRALSKSQVEQLYSSSLIGEQSNMTSPGETIIGEVWAASVIPIDEHGLNGTTVSSSTNATIQIPQANSAPVVSALDFQPASPNSTDNISVIPTQSDVDSDAINTTYSLAVNNEDVVLLNVPFLDTVYSDDSNQVYDFGVHGINLTLGYPSLGDPFEPQNMSGDHCVVGYCYRFDGDADHPDVIRTPGDIDVLDFGTNSNFTIELWVNSSGDTAGTIIEKGQGTDWRLDAFTGNQIRFSTGDGIGGDTVATTTSAPLADNTWHHIAAVRDRVTDRIYIYVDGVLEDDTADVDNTLSNSLSLQIGNGATGGFNGSIDQLKIYNRPLTTTQIIENYNAGLAGHDMNVTTFNETANGEVWIVTAVPIDAKGMNGTNFSSSFTVTDVVPAAPNITGAIFLDAAPENNESFVVNTTASDQNGDEFNLTHNWYVNQELITLLNLPVTPVTLSADGQTVFDVSGNNNHFSTEGNPTYISSCHSGGCYEFDGVDDHLNSTQDVDALDFGATANFTIEFWVNSSGDSSGDIVVKRGSSTASGWTVQATTGNNVQFTIDSPGEETAASSSSPLADNQWHHIAAVRDYGSDFVMIYVDGVLEDTESDLTSGSLENSDPVLIGSGPDGDFAGMIDGLRIHNRALSEEQIVENYNNGAGKTNTTVYQESQVGEIWNATVVAIDANGYNSTPFVVENNATIQEVTNTAPSLSSLTLSTEMENDENVTASVSSSDADSDSTFVTYSWIDELTGNPVTLLNLFFNDVIFVNETHGVFDFAPFENHFSLGYPGSGDPYEPNRTDNCVFGGCYEFDGNSLHPDQIRSNGDIDELDFGTTANFSIEFWVNSSGDSSGDIVVKRGSSTANGWTVQATTGNNVQFTIDNPGEETAVSTSSPLGDNQWHHIVGVRDHGSDFVMIYVDGVLEDTEIDQTSGSLANSESVVIGSGPDGDFSGMVDGLRIWNKSLSEEAIFELYLAGARGYVSNVTVAKETALLDVWNATAAIVDEHGMNGTILESTTNSTIQIPFANTPPVISSLAFTPSSANSTDNISVVPTQSDADSDAINTTYSWRVNDSHVTLLNIPFGDTVFAYDSDSVYDFSEFQEVFTLGYSTEGDPYEPDNVSSCVVGPCYEFDGNSLHPDQIRSNGDLDQVDFGADANFTIEFWINSSGDSSGDIVVKRATTSSNGWTVQAGTGNNVQFTIDSPGEVTSVSTSSPLADNEWHHIVATRNVSSSRIYLYVDGVLEDSDNDLTSGSFANSEPVVIGSGPDGAFSGMVDQVKIYNRTLTITQIIENYNAGLAGHDMNVTTFNETQNEDTWTVLATPIDEHGMNGSNVSDSLLVQNNQLPVIADVSFNATNSTLFTNSDIVAEANYTDGEGSSGTVFFTWYVNGTKNVTESVSSVSSNANATSTLDATNYNKSYVVQVEITPNDGTTNGTAVNSSEVIVANTAPTVSITSDLSSTNEVTDASVSARYLDSNNDAGSVYFEWFVNGVSVEIDNSSVSADGTVVSAGLANANYNVDDTLVVQVHAEDISAENSSKQNSTQITILSSTSEEGDSDGNPPGGGDGDGPNPEEPVCEPDWECPSFSNAACIDGTQTVECSDGCGSTKTESQACELFCEDSDGGNSFFEKGTVQGFHPTLKTPFTGTDKCWATGRLFEHFCIGDKVSWNSFDCPDGSACVDGACVSFGTQCSDTDSTNLVYDESYPPSTHEYYNPMEKGTVEVYDAPADESVTYTDNCFYGNLMEFYCNADGTFGSKKSSCPLGTQCEDGACVGEVCEPVYGECETDFDGVACVDGVQTKTCPDISECGGPSKIVTQDCACVPDFGECPNWKSVACVDEEKTVVCQDLNGCVEPQKFTKSCEVLEEEEFLLELEDEDEREGEFINGTFVPFHAFELATITQDGEVIVKDNALVKDMTFDSNDVSNVEIQVKNVGLKPLSDLRVIFDVPEDAVGLEIYPKQVELLSPETIGSFSATFETNDVKKSFPIKISVMTKETAVLYKLYGILDTIWKYLDKDVMQRLLKRLLPQMFGAIPAPVWWLLFFTFPLLLLLQNTHIIDEKTLNDLTMTRHINQYGKVYVHSPLYLRYSRLRNVKPLLATSADQHEVRELQKIYKIDEELSELIVASKRKYRPQIITSTEIPKILRHKYPLIKFIDPLHKYPLYLIQAYVKRARFSGYHDDEIRKDLLKKGWSTSDITRCLGGSKETEKEKLFAYIKDSLSKGHTVHDIRVHLLAHGWHKNVIKDYIKRRSVPTKIPSGLSAQEHLRAKYKALVSLDLKNVINTDLASGKSKDEVFAKLQKTAWHPEVLAKHLKLKLPRLKFQKKYQRSVELLADYIHDEAERGFELVDIKRRLFVKGWKKSFVEKIFADLDITAQKSVSNYIDKELLDGFTIDEIRDRLVRKGWKTEFVEKVFEKKLTHPTKLLFNYIDREVLAGFAMGEIKKKLIARGWKKDLVRTCIDYSFRKPYNVLLFYIDQMLAQDYSFDEVRNMLLSKGWKHTVVDACLKLRAQDGAKKLMEYVSAELRLGQNLFEVRKRLLARGWSRRVVDTFLEKRALDASAMLVDYIRVEMKAGFALSDIRLRLINKGWDRTIVDTCLAVVTKQSVSLLDVYVKRLLKEGFTLVQIRKKLIAKGWRASFVNEIINTKIKQVDGVLQNYIDTALHKGLTLDEIRDELYAKGWKHDIVDSALQFKELEYCKIIDDYISVQLRLGAEIESVRDHLLEVGWKESLVNRVIEERLSDSLEQAVVYVTQLRKQMVSDEKIRELLKKKGWKNKIIDSLLK